MSPVPVNPFKQLREKQGLSQYDLACRVKISKHAILRLEQGAYQNPLPSVMEYFTSQFPNLTINGLATQYEEFQIAQRQSNAGLFGPDLIISLSSCPVGKHPLTYLITSFGLNTTSTAKALAIAQNVIYYFEHRPVSQHTVPQQLIEALWDADYTEQETDYLKDCYTKHRSFIIAAKKVSSAS